MNSSAGVATMAGVATSDIDTSGVAMSGVETSAMSNSGVPGIPTSVSSSGSDVAEIVANVGASVGSGVSSSPTLHDTSTTLNSSSMTIPASLRTFHPPDPHHPARGAPVKGSLYCPVSTFYCGWSLAQSVHRPGYS